MKKLMIIAILALMGCYSKQDIIDARNKQFRMDSIAWYEPKKECSKKKECSNTAIHLEGIVQVMYNGITYSYAGDSINNIGINEFTLWFNGRSLKVKYDQMRLTLNAVSIKRK